VTTQPATQTTLFSLAVTYPVKRIERSSSGNEMVCLDEEDTSVNSWMEDVSFGADGSPNMPSEGNNGIGEEGRD
jgi:hypothetical protein